MKYVVTLIHQNRFQLKISILRKKWSWRHLGPNLSSNFVYLGIKALRKPSGGLRQSFKYTNYMVILLRKPIVSQVVEWFHFKRSENQNKVLRMKTKFVLNLNSSQSWSSSKQMKDQKSERQKSQNHLTQNQMKSIYQNVV